MHFQYCVNTVSLLTITKRIHNWSKFQRGGVNDDNDALLLCYSPLVLHKTNHMHPHIDMLALTLVSPDIHIIVEVDKRNNYHFL